MRIAATAATLLFALASCSTTNDNEVSPYQQPNQLMGNEISQRIEQIPYQHREELVQNLLWLAQTGEQTIPALLEGLASDNPKVRSSCCWVLGRLRDRRTVPALQGLTADGETSVRMEAARSLVLMGDIEQAPKLIEGLDSERREVRYMCHEALKTATGHDFGYDHLNRNQQELQFAVLRWRQWWGEYSGDQFFAQSYEQANNLNNVAAPGGETKMMETTEPKTDEPDGDEPQSGDEPQNPEATGTQPQGEPGANPESGASTAEPTNQQPANEPSTSEKPATEKPAGEPSTGNGAGAPSPSNAPVIKPPVVDAPKPGAVGAGNGDN
ncbi:MAG: HEAT repeat domain-containing protein [Planctomycetes bacterium]|nr:HEAT repeat domain-containing protein [Planctomycetota bacterium]